MAVGAHKPVKKPKNKAKEEKKGTAANQGLASSARLSEHAFDHSAYLAP